MNIVFLDSCVVIDYINGTIYLDNVSMNNYCFNTVVEMEIRDFKYLKELKLK